MIRSTLRSLSVCPRNRVRAARLFELLRGDIVVCSLRGLSGNERARAADVVDAAARRVRVWVMEGVEGLGGIDLDVRLGIQQCAEPGPDSSAQSDSVRCR